MKYSLFIYVIAYTAALSAISVDIKRGLKRQAISGPEDGATTTVRMNEDNSISEISAVGLRKRTISSDCTPEQRQIIATARERCRNLATFASTAMDDINERSQAYFGGMTDDDRQRIKERFDAIAAECGESNGIINIFCELPTEDGDDPLQCGSGLGIAYSVSESNELHYCPRFFRSSPTVDCFIDDDQATTTIHEMSHQENVYAPSTDHHAFTVKDILKLNNEEKLENADTYSLFARDVILDCPLPPPSDAENDDEDDDDQGDDEECLFVLDES